MIKPAIVHPVDKQLGYKNGNETKSNFKKFYQLIEIIFYNITMKYQFTKY
jgi:hypothetical protein